jgi:hypothetical protein
MILEVSPEQTAEFYKEIKIDLEKQMEAEEYLIESLCCLSGILEDLFVSEPEMNLLSEPLQVDEIIEHFNEANEIPIMEEELFHIIREQEIQETEKVYYND